VYTRLQKLRNHMLTIGLDSMPIAYGGVRFPPSAAALCKSLTHSLAASEPSERVVDRCYPATRCGYGQYVILRPLHRVLIPFLVSFT
jgi:hypothetical protein